MHIRAATIGDASRCADIYAPFVTGSWVSFETEAPDAKEMARRIVNYGFSHGWLVAEIAGEIAGYAYASPHRSRAAYSTSADVAVYVGAQYARQGIGAALYSALFMLLPDKGIHAVFAGIALPNDASIALHRSVGFTPVGIYRQVGWKLDGWRDVGWWQRLL
jgi:L-amino acid N-acyltransferase YncA